LQGQLQELRAELRAELQQLLQHQAH
jgi:hypothetical protein